MQMTKAPINERLVLKVGWWEVVTFQIRWSQGRELTGLRSPARGECRDCLHVLKNHWTTRSLCRPKSFRIVLFRAGSSSKILGTNRGICTIYACKYLLNRYVWLPGGKPNKHFLARFRTVLNSSNRSKLKTISHLLSIRCPQRKARLRLQAGRSLSD